MLINIVQTYLVLPRAYREKDKEHAMLNASCVDSEI